VAGPHSDAVDGEAADLVEDGGRVVAAAAAGARDDQDEVGGERGLPHGGGEDVRVVGLHVGDGRHGAALHRSRGEHEGVGVGELAGPEHHPDRADLVAGRDDGHDGLPRDRQRRVAARRGGAEVSRRQPAARGDEQFAGLEVLAASAHVPAVGHRAGHQGAAVGTQCYPLPLHDGIRAGGHRIARVDPGERGGGQHVLAFLVHGAGDCAGGHRDAVHRGAGETRSSPAGASRRGRHPPEPVADGHLLDHGVPLPAGCHTRRHPPAVGGPRVQSVIGLCHWRHTRTLTPVPAIVSCCETMTRAASLVSAPMA
jgi:hypothetical protein